MVRAKSQKSQASESRRGHPKRVGSQLVVRQSLWMIFDFIEKAGNQGLYKEIADALEDELVARGGAGWNILEELCSGATPGRYPPISTDL